MDIKENYILNFLIFGTSFYIICYACECLLPFLKKKTKIKIKLYHHNNYGKIIVYCCFATHVFFIMFKRELYTSQQKYLMYAVCSSCLLIFLRQIFYSKAETNLCLMDDKSIGALWAHQTYEAYYKKTLENILDRMISFEEKNDIRFFTKKLLIVIPQSCYIEGVFTEKDPLIEEFGNLEIVEDDAGGNINREFKNPVYKICSSQKYHEDVFIVVEYSQPVSALYRSKFILGDEKFVYIRDCYIKTLKLLLQGHPFILVIYDDDENSSENLSNCILSVIEKERRGSDFTV